jgi:hypothetical protein
MIPHTQTSRPSSRILSPYTQTYNSQLKLKKTIPRYFHPQNPNSLKTSIYRKPTFTDTIIPYTSNHPTQHKYAVIRFLFNRMDSYNLQGPEYKQELNTIHNNMHITETTTQQYDTTTKDTNSKTQMGHIYIPGEGDISHN